MREIIRVPCVAFSGFTHKANPEHAKNKMETKNFKDFELDCKDVIGYYDMNSRDATWIDHKIAEAWINYKLQSGELTV